MKTEGTNFWQGKLVRLRGVEPSDAETFARWNLDSETAREHRRRGYATEAALLVLKYYFEELRYQKCLVGVHSNNPASVALHEKLGFVREGTLRRMVYTGGRFYDTYHYGMLSEEWEQSPLRF
jgi:RimJ/RimL family protein N-acetyltransferase